MNSKQNKRKSLIAIIITIVTLIIAGIVYATTTSNSNPYHYVVDVVKDTATNSDDNLEITEKIVAYSNGEFDSKELNYEVQLKNISQDKNVENQVAILVDTSYSMQTNDPDSLAKTKALDFAKGILDTTVGVRNSRVSISTNKGVKQTMINNKTTLTNKINALSYGEPGDGNEGLDYAYSTFTTPSTSGNSVNKYLVVFTDSTDNVSSKMQELVANDPNLKIISILIDITSTSYINNSVPVCGDVYMLYSDTAGTTTVTGVEALDLQKIYNEMNRTVNKITVNNVLNENIVKYFKISDYTSDKGTVTKNADGYTWEGTDLKCQDTATLSFTLTLDTSKDIDAGIIFNILNTDKTQTIEYETYNNATRTTLQGTDETLGDTTAIKICKGYDLKIQAVNELNTSVPVEGVKFQVVGINSNGDTVCNIIKTTENDGYVNITADEVKGLRSDGIVEFTVTPTVNVIGYSATNSSSFSVKNNSVTRTLTDFNDNGNTFVINGSTPYDEGNRCVTLGIPILTQKTGVEVKVEELNNSIVNLTGCDFRLKYPIDSNTWKEASGTIDDNTRSLKFNVPIMTENKEYEYILTQDSAPSTHNKLPAAATIIIKFKDGKVVVGGAHSKTTNVTANADTDLHILVTVANECVAADPFDLQINLKDTDTGDSLEGVTYLVKTIDSNSNIRSEYVTTDVNGQINTKVYGTGLLTIEVTEQSPKVGYTADTMTKQININRNNGKIYILSTNSGNTAYNVRQNVDKTNVIVDLTSKKKTEQNIVHVTLVDSVETDVAVGQGVTYKLVDVDTGISYTTLPSNRKGLLSFTIDNKPQGDHKYQLIVDNTTIPDEYDINSVDSIINLNLSFNNDGYIQTTGGNGINVIDDTHVIESYTASVTGDTSVEYTAFIKIIYEMNLSNTTNFKIQLKDKDTGVAIVGATYDINIEWEISGVTKTKTITGRMTNGSGEISTRIVKGTKVAITVTETAAAAGYNKDLTTQEIYLYYNNTGTLSRAIDQSPYDLGATNTAEPNQGAAENSTGEIVYKHLNRKRSSEDTYLNLTINKIDHETSAYVGHVKMLIESESTTSDALQDKNGDELSLITETDDYGTLTIDYAKYVADMINNETIRVPGIGTTSEEQYYYLNIYELKIDSSSETGYSIKEGTKVRVKLIFRYQDGRVRLTNVEITEGNRLLVNPQIFSSGSDTEDGKENEDSTGVYLANITLDLYTNYDEVGNLSIDFKKENNNGNELVGAYYDLKVTNPDSTVIKKEGIEIKNGTTSSDIEITGLTVNVGSIIEITESQAPTGYALNSNTETLEVTSIAEDGEITLQHIDKTYNPDRLKLTKIASTTTTGGNIKTNYKVTLTDYQLDTFEFGIKTIDSNTGASVDGYRFKIDTDKGAQSTVASNESTRVGGSINDNIITYTVTTTNVANYYKPLNTFNVKVVFDAFGNVDIAATNSAQTDPYYGTLWTIKQLETYGKIEVQILAEHQDPLTVKVQTKDKITNTTINNITYEITPSIDLPATGTTSIDVGYVLQDGIKTYTISETAIANSYSDIANKMFRITYVNGVINNYDLTLDPTGDTVINKTGDKEITLTIYVEPKVPFEITNAYYFDSNTKLQGSNFEVTEQASSDKGTGTTDSQGKTGIYSGIFGTNSYKIYKVTQTSGAIGYATVEDFYVKVIYDGDRKITDAYLVDVNGKDITGSNRFVSVNYITSSTYSNYNGNDLGIVTIDVLNYPELKINIEDVDRRDGITPIAGATYSVTSKYTDSTGTQVNFTNTSGVVTDATGIGIAHIDKTKDNTVVIYTVKEDNPATGYQSYGRDVDIVVTYDSNGYISSVTFDDGTTSSSTANISYVEPSTIVDSVNPEDHFKIDLQLKNNPILKFNLTAEDSADHTVKIKDIGFQMVSKTADGTVYSNSSSINRVNQTETPETSYTDVNGYTASYLDRTIENQTMYYTLTETQKSPGYEWANQDIIIAVTYDNDGKISNASITQGSTLVGYDPSTWLDPNNFEITLDVYNDEIKEFGIHLTAEDTYNSDKKISNMKVEAFLTEGISYTSDGKYELVGDNALQTGIDRDGDGLPDITYGEDYEVIGEYTEGAGTRTLRLVIKNDSRNGYYVYDDKNVGYYKGTQYYSDAYYQTVKYEYLINVNFDDEGKIQWAKLNTGLNSNIGWLTDGRYIEVDENGYLSHTDYKLNITMKFFPMFNLNVAAMDNYTYADEVNTYGLPLSLNGAKYLISTNDHSVSVNRKAEYVEAGYIGYGHLYDGYRRVYGEIYESNNSLYVPIEKNSEREYYIFELSEPTNYQTTNPRLITLYEQRMVAIVNVVFNQYGEIDWANSVTRILKDDNGNPILDNSGNVQQKTPQYGRNGGYLSDANIPLYDYVAQAKANTESLQNMDFWIGYELTTSISVTAVDDISGDSITGIEFKPFLGGTNLTNKHYDYMGESRTYKSDSNGNSSWKYWGGAVDNGQNIYIINSLGTTGLNGYFFPDDLASSSIGGSGQKSDYYAKIKVTYGSDGKISNVESIGSDVWGDDNVRQDITWDSSTGKIHVNLIYSRKFQLTLKKADYYDSTNNTLSAIFDIVSNKGLNRSISSGTMTTIGKVYSNTTVKYTLSETSIPSGYYPIPETIEFYVDFDEDGNIGQNSINSSSEWFDLNNISTSQTTKANQKTSPDLTINIKNKPALTLDLRVIDKFYKADGIEDIYLNITNDKGDVATGNPQTDANGYAQVIAGPIYPGETVTYEISQTNTAPGYYRNSTIIKLEVEYNERGTIEDYRIINGNEVINNFNTTKYLNKKKISMEIMNMPEALKIGLYKYDQTTNNSMDSVDFTINKVDVNTGANLGTESLTSGANGAVIAQIDTFTTTYSGKAIKYTIHEVNTPESYRTMQDVVFVVTYNADGSINHWNQIANDNGELNTNVSIEVAIGTIKLLNDERVHFLVNVPNDNAFDIIIKDEDTNYSGLGIEGTQYDLSINGTTYTPSLTDINGKTKIANIINPQSGNITINVAERTIGEGYRANLNNTININLEKGLNEYSLDLQPSTDGYIDDKNALDTTKDISVLVDEEHGTITVTFKNETKNEITLVKQDVNSKERLENALFEVKKQQVDNSGNLIDDETIITSGTNTDNNGEIYFDLGIAPQSEVWAYTFTELTPPEGYNAIVPLTMKVTYDQYGRIISQESSQTSRLKTVMATQNYNCHSMYAIIYNGDISPAYTIKVVTEDANTGKRINGSSINLEVTDASGDLITIEPKTEASMNNGATDVTANLGLDGIKYSDVDLENPDNANVIVTEKGLVYLDNIDHEGEIHIGVSQVGTAEGYVYGTNNTNGNIVINASYVPHLNGDPTVEFTMINNDNMDVTLDNNNREIKITIKNTSQVLFDITTAVYGDINTKIQGASYTITATEETVTDSLPTSVNTTTTLSDVDGKTTGDVGNAYAGKTIKYTLAQTIPEGYQPIDDIQIEVTYDGKGYIKYIEPITSMEKISINETDTVGGRIIYLTVYNNKELGDYQVSLEKHAEDTDENLNAYDILIPGATYEIKVEQEYGGISSYTWKATTDSNGYIQGLPFSGYGNITIYIKELYAPSGYKVDDSLRMVNLHRDGNTGRITNMGETVNFTIVENTSEICLKPVDQQLNDRYTFIIKKYSTATGEYVTTDQTKFKAELKQEDADGNVIYQDTIDEIYTVDGKATMNNQKMPPTAGEYTLKITELKAPNGYKALTDPIEIPITFIEDSKGNIAIDSVNTSTLTNQNITIAKVNKQTISINVGNDVDMELAEDEYLLDISKVDAATNTEIREQAVFKVLLPDMQNTSVYVETINDTLLGDGKLDYCYIEENKDYAVRLTHMKIPTASEILDNLTGKITHTYVFEEVAAPEGYAKIGTPLQLDIEFSLDTVSNEVYISKLTSSDPTYLKINTPVPCSTQTYLDIDILNDEQESSYTVHYDANTTDTVTVPADQLKTAGMPLTLDANVPVRSGFTFVEWNTAADGTGTAFSPAGTYGVDADVTLYAIWEVAQYTVHYESNAPIDSNTGVAIGLVTDMPTDQTKTHGIDITLDDDNLTPSIPNVANYYEFAGWNTLSDGTGTHYDAGDVYNIDSELTLYAEWNYIIRYNANVPTDSYGFPMSTANDIPTDQHENVNSQTDAIIDDLQVYTNAPTMVGYKFKEWNTSADGTGDTYNPNDTYTSRKGIDLYAIWQYEIIYDENKPVDANGFQINASISNMPIANPQVVDVNNTAIVDNTIDNPSVPTIMPDDYVFVEWNTKPDGSGDSYNPDDVYSGNISVKLYAIWEKNEDLYLKSNVYIIGDKKPTDYVDGDETVYEEGDKYIIGIMPKITANKPEDYNENNEGTTIAKFKENIKTNAKQIKIYDERGAEIINENELVFTGATLELTKDSEVISITLIVRGDFKDGVLALNDYNQFGNYLSKGISTIINTEAKLKAFDVNLDGRVNMRDYNLMANALSSINNTALK